MKIFIIELLNSFKLNQMKEKIKENRSESYSNIELAKSNLWGLIYVYYEDENRNIFEPIELEKSGINFRKLFVDYLRESSLHNNFNYNNNYSHFSREISNRYDNWLKRFFIIFLFIYFF